MRPIFLLRQSIKIHIRNTAKNISTSTSRHLPLFNTSRSLQTLKPTTTSAASAAGGPFFHFRSLHEASADEDPASEGEEDGPMNEFLSRFVSLMRSKLVEAYPDCERPTIDSMLLVIARKVVSEMDGSGLDPKLRSLSASAVSADLSEDLWRTVWEISNSVFEGMKNERRRREMKGFLQCDDVKAMCRFAADVGVRGDLLHEFRLKWAREKLEESERYRELMRNPPGVAREEAGTPVEVVDLPKRRGKIKYKIHGLDLSGPEWAEVAFKTEEGEKRVFAEVAKPVMGKCKLVTERVLAMREGDDLSGVVGEWKELLEPSRVDWVVLMERAKERSQGLHYKLAELLLDEESYRPTISDYSKLIDNYAKEGRVEDAERILNKMTDKGLKPDAVVHTILVHLYSKAGNLELAEVAFNNLRSQDFRPSLRLYSSMIMAYVKAGSPKSGEALMKEMEMRDIKPTNEIYMGLLKAFAERGHVDGAQRIFTTMQIAGLHLTLESCTLVVEAYGRAGDVDHARSNFDFMLKAGHKPDDRCVAAMIAAYEKKNMLDKALNLLLELEKDGFEPGTATYSVLVDWLGKLQLVDEAEQMLMKINEKGEEAPFEINVSICEMYSRAGVKEKAFEALQRLEAEKERLREDEFERIVEGLLAGGFVSDAKRVHELMQERGFVSSERLRVSLMAAQAIPRRRPRPSK
ncbi:hypothetical protein QJS10_CPB20g00671 [Acorus calamus]|uniref:PROP1-like PPR domain-containing protein n=1 Tax=Acorus calamus TaxID=4465 RepID=A0AAV9C9X9_ACOCL|nr:hypothetical protein QJS10_CPB20g00671 [Acorus calamus]